MMMRNRINDISQSLEFCKMSTLHSTILTTNEMSALTSLVKTKNISLISFEPAILWELSKVHCSLTKSQIHYFIALPLQSPPLETYFLLSHPYRNADKIETIIPTDSFIIKDRNILYKSDACVFLINNFYCPKPNVQEISDRCVQGIVTNPDP